MNFINKAKIILTLGSANFSSSIINALFWLFLATLLIKSEYGELGFLMSVANVGIEISLLGLNVTVLVYASKNENILPASFFLVLISSSIVGIIAFILTQNFAASILIIGMTLFYLILAGLNSKKRYKSYSIYVLFRVAITVILALIFYQIFGINGILLGYFVASLLILKELSYFLKGKKIEFSRIRTKIRFTFQMWSDRLSGVLFWWGDKLIIGSLFGFTVLGNYYFAAQYLLLLQTIPMSIGQYLVQQESEGQKNRKIKIFSIFVSVLVAIISILGVPYGVNMILPQYEESVFPIQIMSIAIIPLTISTIQQSEFLGKEKSQFVLIGSFIQTGLYFSLIIILGQTYGLIGLAMGLLVSAILRPIINLILRRYT